MAIRVMLIDGDGIFRLGVGVLLGRESDIAVVGEAGSVQDIVLKAFQLKPDVVLMDMRLPEGNGVEGIRLLKEAWPGIQVLILTHLTDDDTVFRAISAGAVGYILKDIPPEELAGAVRSVCGNRTVLNPAIARRVLERLATSERSRNGSGTMLSERELQVLRGVAEGLSDKEIAQQLFLSVSTIKSHVRSIFQKLRLRNRAQAAAYAARYVSSIAEPGQTPLVLGRDPDKSTR